MSIHPTSKDPGEAFRKAWGEGEKDLSKVTKEERDKRNEGSREITDAYYDLANDNLEQGWNRKFHFCRFQHGESIDAALSRHEHFMALMTNMKPGFKVLDVGCGNGAPARTIASFIGGHVTGITINKPQIERAKRYSKEEGLSECVEFVEGDFTKMPFADNTFDTAYAMEATCYSPTLEEVYGEVARVLKPGGYWGTYEWLMTDKYDDKDPVQNEIRSRIERGDGVCSLRNRADAIKAIKAVGLELVTDEDLGPTNYRNPVPWWWCIDGDLSHAKHWRDKYTVFRLKRWVYIIVSSIFWVLELLRIVRKGRYEAIQTMAMACFAMRDGGKSGIFTNMHMFIAKKPLNWVNPNKKSTGSNPKV